MILENSLSYRKCLERGIRGGSSSSSSSSSSGSGSGSGSSSSGSSGKFFVYSRLKKFNFKNTISYIDYI